MEVRWEDLKKEVVCLRRDTFSSLEAAKRKLLKKLKRLGFKQACIALVLMDKYHKNQFRKGGKPYAWHPIRMARFALRFPGVTDDIIATILLHDVIEEKYHEDLQNGDNPEALINRADYKNKVAQCLPIRASIRKSVILLTTLPDPDETMEQKVERKADYFAGIDGTLESSITKLFDRIDNLLDAPGKLSRESIIKNLIETDILLIPTTLRAEARYPDSANLIRSVRILLEMTTMILALIYGVKLEVIRPFHHNNNILPPR